LHALTHEIVDGHLLAVPPDCVFCPSHKRKRRPADNGRQASKDRHVYGEGVCGYVMRRMRAPQLNEEYETLAWR
jgi:hypothetical protein